MNAWSHQLTQQAKKVLEDELYIQSLKIAFDDTNILNDLAIGQVLTKARSKGLDGRRILQKAFNEHFGGVSLPSPDTNNAVLEQGRVAVVSQKVNEPGFQCPVCNKQFKSQAALSGHGGINRCKG